jgi:hypothetical protein
MIKADIEGIEPLIQGAMRTKITQYPVFALSLSHQTTIA